MFHNLLHIARNIINKLDSVNVNNEDDITYNLYVLVATKHACICTICVMTYIAAINLGQTRKQT